MESYHYASDTPAIREASDENPWRCPWCGENTWIVSRDDVEDDLGRVQMFCSNDQCESQETELLVMRAYDATTLAQRRADIRALRAIDDGVPEGYRVTGTTMDKRLSGVAERARRRTAWRQSQATYTMEVPGWDSSQQTGTP